MSGRALFTFLENVNKNDEKRSMLILNLLDSVSQSLQLTKHLLLICEDVSNWQIRYEYCCSTRRKRHHIIELLVAGFFGKKNELLSFIIESFNPGLSFDLDNTMYQLVVHGYLREFALIMEKKPSSDVQQIRSFVYSIFERISSFAPDEWRENILGSEENLSSQNSQNAFYSGSKKFLNVFTSGANENMSLGNPLGTSKRQRIFFTSHYNFIPDKVVVGNCTTIFLGTNPSSTVFVSGRFGEEHFMTPQPFALDDDAVCADVGLSHAIICCKKFFYCIGDNSSNQLGAGSNTARLTFLNCFHLPQLDDSDEIVDCATSARHSVIVTRKELFVSGENFGQLGEYAARSFRPNADSPKTFFRMLRPEDPFLKYGGVGVTLADNMTVIYGGNRARIFFEYREHAIFFYNPHYSNTNACDIVYARICKFFTNTAAAVLFFSSNKDVYLWQRHCSGKSITPICKNFDENLIFERKGVLMDKIKERNNGQIACAANGDFMICDIPHRVRRGSISFDESGNPQIITSRMTGLPGFVERVFMSHDGRNYAYITSNELDSKKITQRREKILEQRLILMNLIRTINGQLPLFSGLDVVLIESKTKKFYVHRFMLMLRAPQLLRERWFKNDSVSLRRVNDRTVKELLEFIYLGTNLSFRVAEGSISKFSKSDLLECDINSSYDINSSTTQDFIQDEVNVEECMEIVDANLIRMAELAHDLRWTTLKCCVAKASQAISERYCDCKISDSFSFDDQSNISDIFSEKDDLVALECDSGTTLQFPRKLLCESPYFDTLFRWHEHVNTVKLEGISTEMLNVVLCFLISRELNEAQLNFEQILELLVFADHYSFANLADEAVYLLERELHMDNIGEVLELAKVLYLDRLEEAIGLFVFRHFFLFFDSVERIAVLKILSERSLSAFAQQCLPQTLENSCLRSHYEQSIRGSGPALLAEYRSLVIEFLHEMDVDIEDNEMSAKQFLQLVKKYRQKLKKEADSHNDICMEANSTNMEKTFKNVRIEPVLDYNEEFLSPTLSNQSESKCVKEIEPDERLTSKKQEENIIISCWKIPAGSLGNGSEAVPIAAQLAEEFELSPATKKNWKRHRNAHGRIFAPLKSEPIDISGKSNEKTSAPAWGASTSFASSPKVASLGEIMRQEALSQPQKTKDSPKSDIIKASPVAQSSNWSQSPVSSTMADVSPLQQSVVSLRRIQAEETAMGIRKAQAEERRAKKQLNCVAVEELAIRELQQYYETLYAANETPAFFVVRRQEETEKDDSKEFENVVSLNDDQHAIRIAGNKTSSSICAAKSAMSAGGDCGNLRGKTSSFEEHLSNTMQQMKVRQDGTNQQALSYSSPNSISPPKPTVTARRSHRNSNSFSASSPPSVLPSSAWQQTPRV